MWKSSIVGALLVLLVPALSPATDVMETLARMRRAAEPGQDMRAKIEFVMTNDGGERVQWAGGYYRRSGADAVARLVFHSPPDIRGVEVAVRRVREGADRTRIYLPFIRRVRELEADRRGESLLGTDFNYEELGLVELDFHNHAIRGEGQVDGRSCYLVESVPDQSCGHGKIVRCIDKEDFLPRETQYYDRTGLLFKVRMLSGVEKIGPYPTPTVITMQTIPFNTSTRIELSDVQYDTGLPDSILEGQ
jgi:hypothetical protein